MNHADYTDNLLKIDPALLLSNACLTKDSTGYLVKYRFKNVSGVDTHELHVHYNGVLPGVLSIGATVCEKLLTHIATKQVKALRY